MKVLLVGTYPLDRQYSMMGFANALQSGLPAHGVEMRLITPAAIAGRTIIARGKLGKWLGHLDKLVLFPFCLRRALGWADVVHLVDHGLAVYVKHLRHKPHVITCNDLIAMRAARGELPEWRGVGTMGIFQRMIEKGLNHAQHVACISEATRADLCRLTQVAPGRASVVYDSLFHDYSPVDSQKISSLIQPLGLLPKCRFILHVGRNVPTKNRIGVLQIFAELRQHVSMSNLHLVMVGEPLSPELRAWISEHQFHDVVHELSHLRNEEMRALYSSAQALVFPSLYEGFGLPIIEAQACGCPVFTSARAPMTEVGGNAAVYFDPTQVQEATHIILDHLQSPEKLRGMIDRGFSNIQRFAPDRMFREYVEIYHRVLSEGTETIKGIQRR